MAKETEITAPADQLRVVVVTPEATLVDDLADFVALPLFDGEIGIAALHSPLIGRLGFGEMRLKKGEVEKRYYVDGGFVQVADNVVSVLTNRAVDAKDLSAAAAESQLEAAIKQKADTDELLAIRDRSIAQSRAQLRTIRHAK
ncbi:MAG: ATP synthase F1 subunit epsilon [Planctomycetales bacterium]|nr:ATP synthase F1 subunit epsilon [Planctomycetales bacterium]MBN8627468.1 ATP synthase F1 subunit epsilon [Planctomycetota bacterium]